ncbi:MAG: hypothetical protein K0R16_2377, partial [Nitrososphaeraceae archaeon]|nr:hypothetical protein [Nitrososphaeraceae archaeon]
MHLPLNKNLLITYIDSKLSLSQVVKVLKKLLEKFCGKNAQNDKTI